MQFSHSFSFLVYIVNGRGKQKIIIVKREQERNTLKYCGLACGMHSLDFHIPLGVLNWRRHGYEKGKRWKPGGGEGKLVGRLARLRWLQQELITRTIKNSQIFWRERDSVYKSLAISFLIIQQYGGKARFSV